MENRKEKFAEIIPLQQAVDSGGLNCDYCKKPFTADVIQDECGQCFCNTRCYDLFEADQDAVLDEFLQNKKLFIVTDWNNKTRSEYEREF